MKSDYRINYKKFSICKVKKKVVHIKYKLYYYNYDHKNFLVLK